MTERTRVIAAAIGLSIGLGCTAALAGDEQIAALQKQLRALEERLDAVQKQSFVNANAAYSPKKAAPFPDVTVKMAGNRPMICTADGFNCVGITGRLHLDVGAYDYRPNTAFTNPQRLNDGVNARRARLGVVGTFARDFEFGLILDGGGTTDGTASLNQAFLIYRGFKSFHNLAIEGGYIDVPYTLDEATSSNNIMFLERAAPNVVATSINAGDSRSALGLRMNEAWWWAGAYVTGPTTGTGVNHSQRQPLGATGRLVFVPINSKEGSLLIGGDVSYLAQTAGAPNVYNLTLSDRIEVRIDPASNALLSTGALTNVDSALVLSAEAAAQVGSFYAQGEYYDYTVQRKFGQGESHFNGGYAQASFMLTGEARKYSAAAGAYGGINPKNPVDFLTGGWGAWEIAGRYSYVNLNDTDAPPAIRGGRLQNTTVGLNWYATQNVRFMFNWIHGKVYKRDALSRDVGASYDVYAARMQFAF
jgi:phosphate-selective porin OprO/OprP